MVRSSINIHGIIKRTGPKAQTLKRMVESRYVDTYPSIYTRKKNKRLQPQLTTEQRVPSVQRTNRSSQITHRNHVLHIIHHSRAFFYRFMAIYNFSICMFDIHLERGTEKAPPKAGFFYIYTHPITHKPIN